MSENEVVEPVGWITGDSMRGSDHKTMGLRKRMRRENGNDENNQVM
jgi:hypothetical protein